MSIQDPPMAAALYDSPGHYVRSRRVGAGLSIEDVALCLDTEPAVTHRRRVEWLTAIERDVLPVRPTTAAALRAIGALAIDDYLLAELMERAEGDAMAVRFRPTAGEPA